MTPTARRQVKVGVVTTVIGGALLFLIGAVKNQVVPRSEYALHVQQVESGFDRVGVRDSVLTELVKDVLCADAIRPMDRRCR